MSTVSYKCPCCASPLLYDGASGKMNCPACGNQFDLETVKTMYEEQSGGQVDFQLPQEGYPESDVAQMKAFHCKSCGAELITEGTTTATECPYCGSPTILPEHIEGGVRPELVVPFVVTKEQAQQQFMDYFKGKALLPNIFLQGDNQIAEIRRLFVPYWLFDCDASASMVYDAEKRETHREDEWEIEEIEHYIVRRAGRMRFHNIPVDGSVKLEDDITESLEPYDLSAAVPFEPAVLSGAMADHADVNAEDCEARAAARVESTIARVMRDSVTGFTSVTERTRNIRSENGKVTPVLMPVWLITTVKEGKTYTFAINGQTGKLTCDVPVAKGKAFLWGAGVFAGVFGLAALVLYLMKMLGSGTLLLGGILALIVALLVVFGMIGKLQQATAQGGASDYVEEDGSDHITVSYEHYLYTTTERRRIETPKAQEPDAGETEEPAENSAADEE